MRGHATCFEELIRLGNSNPTIYNDYGNALQALHEDDAAVAKYKKAIELDPGYADACYNLGILYQTNKQFGEAVSQY
jgi:protein O-GlcNAc transferase